MVRSLSELQNIEAGKYFISFKTTVFPLKFTATDKDTTESRGSVKILVGQ